MTTSDRPAAAVFWFRRDLRLSDNPALAAALERAGGHVAPLFVLDKSLRDPAGAPRLAYLAGSLAALDESLNGHLVIRSGSPQDSLPRVIRAVAAERECEVSDIEVHLAEDFGPYGRARDEQVFAAIEDLTGRKVQILGSSYAISPGRVRNQQGQNYKVFTPFFRAWLEHGWRPPAEAVDPSAFRWIGIDSDGLPKDKDPFTDVPGPSDLGMHPGENSALTAWHDFLEDNLSGYRSRRDQPAVAGTSLMSVHLKWGEVHARTLLADLGRVIAGKSGPTADAEAYRRELGFREFYADVLLNRPASARESMSSVVPDDAWERGQHADELFSAWADGRTGYPIVDAGMRQLLEHGWMHNRVRMIVASFLVKDLMIDWQRGARHFMAHLVDGDLASNQHGWQWAAGTGTDAAPYFRIFNPTTQGEKFDPQGDYVRRYVPELRGIAGKAVHQPWKLGDDAGDDARKYPAPLVDHKEARAHALDAYGRRPK